MIKEALRTSVEAGGMRPPSTKTLLRKAKKAAYDKLSASSTRTAAQACVRLKKAVAEENPAESG